RSEQAETKRASTLSRWPIASKMTLAQVRPPGAVPPVWSFPVLTQTGIILRSTAQKKIRFSCNLSARIPHSSSGRYGMKKLMIAASLALLLSQTGFAQETKDRPEGYVFFAPGVETPGGEGL